MTQQEFINIAKRLDKKKQELIDKEVEERLKILKEGELTNEEMIQMEECLYKSLVLQEYLDSEFELLEDEKTLLLEEMESLYNEYGDLLLKAKIEEKLSRKKRMALQLLTIRQQLFQRKELLNRVKDEIKDNRNNKDKLDKSTNKKKMKDISKESKEKGKWGFDRDSGVSGGGKAAENKEKNKQTEKIKQEAIQKAREEAKKEVQRETKKEVEQTVKKEVSKQVDKMKAALELESRNESPLGGIMQDTIVNVDDIATNTKPKIGMKLNEEMFKELNNNIR